MAMTGPQHEAQPALFYEFSLEDHVPRDHLALYIDRFVDLSSIRAHLADFYSHTGRPTVDPELLIRMLLIGYRFGICPARRLCDEVHLNLAYRCFCGIDLASLVPDHSTFSKNRLGRFFDTELLRHLFETSLARCIERGVAAVRCARMLRRQARSLATGDNRVYRAWAQGGPQGEPRICQVTGRLSQVPGPESVWTDRGDPQGGQKRPPRETLLRTAMAAHAGHTAGGGQKSLDDRERPALATGRLLLGKMLRVTGEITVRAISLCCDATLSMSSSRTDRSPNCRSSSNAQAETKRSCDPFLPILQRLSAKSDCPG